MKERDNVQIIGFAKDPNTAFVLSNIGRDKAVIYEYDVRSRKQKEVLFEHRFFDASRVLVSRYKGEGGVAFGDILGVTTGARGTRTCSGPRPLAQAIEKGIRGAMGLKPQPLKVTDPATGQSAEMEYDLDASFQIVSWTPDLKNVVVVVSGDRVRRSITCCARAS